MTASDEWPLIGRDVEFSTACAALERGIGVVLHGGAGVGKTRLALACLAQARRSGHEALRVIATHATASLPFGAFAPLLPELEAGTTHAQVLARIVAHVRRRGNGRPVALLVDDAHLLDDSSAALTCQLAASSETTVIATVRAGSPVRDGLASLWKDDLAVRIDVGELSEDAVAELLAAALGGSVEGVTVRDLYARSVGNVLFLRELVLGAVAGGHLRLEAGLWRLTGRPPMSQRLYDLLDLKLQKVSAIDRTAMEYLALGEPLELTLLERILGGPADLDQLERDRLIVSTASPGGIEISFGHPLYGDLIRDGISPRRTQQIASTLADAFALSEELVTTDRALRVGVWRLHSGGDADPEIMLSAAQRAVTLHDITLAHQLAQASVAAGGGFHAALLLAQILSWKGEHEEAERRYAAISREPVAGRDLAVLTISRIDNLAYGLGRWTEAMHLADSAEAALRELPDALEFRGYRASLFDVAGNTTQLDDLGPVLERGEGRALAWACAQGAWIAARQGRLSEALALTERGQAAHDSFTWPPLPWGPDTGIVIRAWAMAFTGKLQDAHRTATEVYDRALDAGDLEAVSIAATTLCATCVLQGQPTQARRWGMESLSTARRHHRRAAMVKSTLVTLAEALVLAGLTDEAMQIFTELAELAPMPMFESERKRAEAWLLVCRDDDIRGAIPLLWHAASLATNAGNWFWESCALHDLARLGSPAAVVDRLDELASIMEGPLIAARALHAHGLVDRDAERLSAAAEQFGDIGAMVLAAEAAADASVAWSAVDQRRATTAMHRAAILMERCPDVRTPGLRVPTTARIKLRPRQLEIAKLAAGGASNRQIAERLHLSLRTIENQLHEVYQRLGINGREELRTLLGR